MPSPAWMKGRPTAEGANRPDVWNGTELPDRNVIHTNINYRLYDRRNGALLSFNSTNSLDCLVTDVLRTRDEHPTAQIVAVEYDGPAYPN